MQAADTSTLENVFSQVEGLYRGRLKIRIPSDETRRPRPPARGER